VHAQTPGAGMTSGNALCLAYEPLGWEGTVVAISLSETDANLLRQTLEARLVELRREISHTDSPRFREMLYQVDGMLQRVIQQLPVGAAER